jgi:hypothetical protein
MGGRGPDVVGVGGGEGVVVNVGLDNGVGLLGLSGRLGDGMELLKGKRAHGAEELVLVLVAFLPLETF